MDYSQQIEIAQKIQPLGFGESGFVNLYQNPDGSQFALKFISICNIKRKGLGYVLREIYNMSKLRGHPHVVEIYGIHFQPQGLEIAMEALEGNILEFPFTPELLSQMISEIFPLLEVMKSLNIRHNDLHPQNIFYKRTSQGYQFKLGDFGYSSTGFACPESAAADSAWSYDQAPEYFDNPGINRDLDYFVAGIICDILDAIPGSSSDPRWESIWEWLDNNKSRDYTPHPGNPDREILNNEQINKIFKRLPWISNLQEGVHWYMVVTQLVSALSGKDQIDPDLFPDIFRIVVQLEGNL